MQSNKGKWDAPKIVSFEPANDGTGDRILKVSFCVPATPQPDANGKVEVFHRSKTLLGRTPDGRKVMLTLDLTVPAKSVTKSSLASPASAPLIIKPPSLNERTVRARVLLEAAGCTLPSSGAEAQYPSLMEAVRAQDVAGAFALLAAGCDPNERDESTATAIARAVITGNAVMVELLSLFGADASLTNAHGISAWAVLERPEYSHLQGCLLSSGGVIRGQDVVRQKHPHLQELEALS